MWINFFVACLLAVFLMYVPGCLAFGGSLAKKKTLLAWAPFVSLFLLFAFGEAFYVTHIQVSGFALLCVTTAAGLLIGAIGYFLSKRKKVALHETATVTPDAGNSFAIAGLYVVLGLAVSAYAFLSVIGSPDWFATEIDNAFHLNEVYAMASTGQFSAFSISTFPTVAGFASTNSGSFYPALWHVVVAVLLNTVATSAPIAENATNLVFVAIAFPLGIWAFLSSVLSSNKTAILAGSLTCVCFFDFPWRLLTFGLLCSNLASFAMVPTALAVFVSLVKLQDSIAERLKLALLLVTASICLALLQPNAIFSCVALLAFFAISQILHGKTFCGFTIKQNHRIWLAILFALACIVFWAFAYNSSFMRGVLSVNWAHISSKVQGIFNILLLSYCDGPANPVMAAFVLIGAISAFRNKELRWLVFAYALCAAIHYSTASTESIFKHILAGFWYTDPRRTAALCALGAIPLSAIGFASVIGFCKMHAIHLKESICDNSRNKAIAGISLVIAALLLTPSFDIVGLTEVETTFGTSQTMIKSSYDMSKSTSLSTKEINFVKRAKQITGDDVVINSPFDGTAFLYGVTGVQFYYRSLLTSPENNPNEPAESRAFRHSLYSYTTNADAATAIKKTGAKYVLLLDSAQKKKRKHVFTYQAKDWTGIASVEKAKKGFELILKEGDMRLYRITGANN